MSEIWLGYYGDDFSGSADVMEVLAQAGVPTVLFLAPPTEAQLARFPDVRAIGIAGIARSLRTAAMEAELRPAFESLRRLAPLVHYKICSTFDSSPEIGSIGRAIDIGRVVLGTRVVPVVVGAPALGRYCVFGNLFARSGGGSPIYRLDRHPTMAAHPVTPMDEADLTQHLARQTSAEIALLNALVLDHAATVRFNDLVAAGAEIIMIDTLYERHMPIIGELIASLAERDLTRFVVGSSGVEYALTARWRAIGVLPALRAVCPAKAASPVVVVSGSCSPVTAAQIRAAAESGFRCVALQPEEWLEGNLAGATEQTLKALKAGESVIVHAATGPDDPRIAEANEKLTRSGRCAERNALLGDVLARLLSAAINAGVRRCAVAGGDTSGHVARTLGIESLEFIAPLAPGSPLCRARFHDTTKPDLEICFKGGQVGRPDFFQKLARGTA